MDPLSPFESVQYGPSLIYWGGELDLATRGPAERSLLAAAEAGGLIMVDISNVTFMDSTALHVLVTAAHAMPSGCIVLHGCSRFVEKVLEQTGLSRHVRLHVVPCDEDPFPDGRGLRGNGTTSAVYLRLLAMKAKHQELVEQTRWAVDRATDTVSASASTRERVRTTRGELRSRRRLAA